MLASLTLTLPVVIHSYPQSVDSGLSSEHPFDLTPVMDEDRYTAASIRTTTVASYSLRTPDMTTPR